MAMVGLLNFIIVGWLFSCGCLLKIPLTLNVIEYLSFVLGFVWALVAGSWALLALLQPNLSWLEGFTAVLYWHFQTFPGLYAVHTLVGLALISWVLWVYYGLVARTHGRTRFLIQRGAALLLIFFLALALIVPLDMISYCQPPDNPTGSTGRWFRWVTQYTSASSTTPLTPIEVTAKVEQLQRAADVASRDICKKLADEAFAKATRGDPTAPATMEAARHCDRVTALYGETMSHVRLTLGRLPREASSDGFQGGLKSATETVLQPLLERAAEGAARGAAESILEGSPKK